MTWALGAKWPERVTANGGRYQTEDDWEFYDTLDVAINYQDKFLTWKGECINGKKTYGRDRGVAIHGTEGTVVVDRESYEVFDLNNKMKDSYKDPGYGNSSAADTIGTDHMTDAHFGNFIAAIRTNEPLRQPVAQGNVAVTLMQLSNISYFTGRDPYRSRNRPHPKRSGSRTHDSPYI